MDEEGKPVRMQSYANLQSRARLSFMITFI